MTRSTHALHDRGALRVQRRHARVTRLAVGHEEAADDVRVLRAVEVVLVAVGLAGEVVEAIRRRQVRRRGARHRLVARRRRSARTCSNSCLWNDAASPPTVAAATYIRAYQLIWFSRSVGHAQNFPLAVETIRSAIRSPSTPSTSRAFHAIASAHAISVSTTRCWMPPPLSPSRQPGTCACDPRPGALGDPRRSVAELVDQRPRPLVLPRRPVVAHAARRPRASTAGSRSPSPAPAGRRRWPSARRTRAATDPRPPSRRRGRKPRAARARARQQAARRARAGAEHELAARQAGEIGRGRRGQRHGALLE